jgi:hypothetical protein
MQRAPARRYANCPTLLGFTGKSCLTIERLAGSLAFLRQAKSDCMDAVEAARSLRWSHPARGSRSGAAEFASNGASESGAEFIAGIDRAAERSTLAGGLAVTSFVDIDQPFGAVATTDLVNGRSRGESAVAAVSGDRALEPGQLQIVSNGAGSS